METINSRFRVQGLGFKVLMFFFFFKKVNCKIKEIGDPK